MRKVFAITAFAFYGIAVAVAAAFFQLHEPDGSLESTPKSRFLGLTTDIERPVELALDNAGTLATLSAPQAEEQVRDWLLYLVLTSRRMDAKSIAELTFDMPPYRRGETETSASFQYGLVRSSALSPSEAVVLLPAGQSAAERSDDLAHVADRHVVQQGRRPETIHILEYCLDLERGNVSLVLRTPLPGERLFSSEYGYVEATLSTRSDLEEFLNRTNDLISARVRADGVQVAGRWYKKRPHGQITVEHVATLWQAFQQIDRAREADAIRRGALLEQWARADVQDRIKSADPALAKSIDEAERLGHLSAADRKELATMRRKAREELTPIMQRFDEAFGTCRWQSLLLSQKKETKTEGAWLRRLMTEYATYRAEANERQKSLLRGAAGFSLDSAYDFNILLKSFEEFVDSDKSPAGKALAPIRADIVEQLKRRDAALLLCTLGSIKGGDELEALRGHVENKVTAPARYQTARYDGGIAGTEVGQILFLTDLLAKLLDMDFSGTFDSYFDRKKVNWRPTVYELLPAQYREEQKKLPGTRIWFGLRSEAHTVAKDRRTVDFTNVATRVFALSSGTLQDSEDETQPTYLAQRFVSWFNNYYEQVASAEQSYDQLNQIIKWSLALDLTYAELGTGTSRLASTLNEQTVRRDLWFPEWVKTTLGVRREILWLDCIHPKGRFTSTVETMAVLHVDWDDPPPSWCASRELRRNFWSMQGGVSLPRSQRKAEAAVQDAFASRPLVARANALSDGLAIRPSTTNLRLTPEYNFRRSFEITSTEANSADIIRKTESGKFDKTGKWDAANGQVFHRGSHIDLRNAAAREQLRQSTVRDQLMIESKVSEETLARTSFTARQDIFRIRQDSEAVDIGYLLALKIGREPREAWHETLLRDRRVSAVAQLNENSLLVRLEEDRGWLELALEQKSAVGVPQGWLARASAPPNILDLVTNNMPRVVDVRRVSEPDVTARISAIVRITIEQHPRGTDRLGLYIRGPPNEPPPPGARNVSFGPAKDPFRGFFQPSTRQVHLSIESGKQSHLSETIGLLSRVDLAAEASKTNAPLALTFETKASVTSDTATVLKLATQLNDATNSGFKVNATATLAAIRKARSDHIAAIETASKEGRLNIANDMIDSFHVSYRPTHEEALLFAEIRLSDGMPRQTLTELHSLLKQPTRPDLSSELAKRAEAIAKEKGAAAGADEVNDIHLLLAEASAERQGNGLRFTRERRGVDGSVKATLYHPIEFVPLGPEEVERATAIYVDTRLGLGELAPGQTINEVVRDGMVVRVMDPASLAHTGLASAQPDSIALGELIVFNKARGSVEKPTAAQIGGANEAWVGSAERFFNHAALGYVGSAGGSDAGPPSMGGGADGSSDASGGPSGTTQFGLAAPSSLLLVTSAGLLADYCFAPPHQAAMPKAAMK